MNPIFLSATGMIPAIMQIVVTIGTVLVGWWAYQKHKENPGRDIIREFFAGSLVLKLEILAFFTTASECIGLSILAIGRNVDVFNAISRFVIFCGLEVATIYFFIMYSSKIQEWILRKMMTKFLKDKKFDAGEIIQSLLAFIFYLVFAAILFPFFCVPTFIICIFYFEASGVLLVTFGELSFLPWELISIKENTEHVSNFIEFAAFMVIWLTPGITLMQIIFTPMELAANIYKELAGKDKSKDKDKKKKKKKSKWDDDDDDDDDDTIDTEFEDVLKSLSEIQKISEQGLQDRFDELIGKGGKTPTNPSIKNKSKTVEEFKEELCELFLGDGDIKSPKGILGYRRLEQKIKAETSIELNKIAQEITTQDALAKSATGTDKTKAEKTLLTLKSEKRDVLKEIKKLKDLKTDIVDDLEDHLTTVGLYP